MLVSLLLKGMLIGFSIAMPVGPIGMLCIRNSLSWGSRFGLVTGLGAAAADTFYGGLAGFGLAAVTTILISYKMVLQIFGGLFLCYLGLQTMRVQATSDRKNFVPTTLPRVFLTTFFLTLTNPMTILSFIGIYAGLGVGLDDNSFNASLVLTLGVFLGSALWWMLLSKGAALFKNKINSNKTKWLNRISGSILLGFGIAAFFV